MRNPKVVVGIVLVVVAVGVTVGISAAVTSHHSLDLPVPHPVAPPPAHGATTATTGPAAGAATTTTTTTAPESAVVPLTPSAPFVGCTLSVSNPSPPRGATQETVHATGNAGAYLRVAARYPSVSVVHGTAIGVDGTATIQLNVRSSPAGVTVTVAGEVRYRHQQAYCTTSFTPVA